MDQPGIGRTLRTALFAGVCFAFWCESATSAERPNIIFILSDDLAQGDVGCYGQKLIQTPHLDRMAREGTRFTQAYCGTTVCAPSRASLMTGLHTGHSPVRANWEIAPGEGQLPLPDKTVTVANILKDAGYATACCGKWGMGMFDTTGSPLRRGFEHFFGYNCQRHAHSYFPTHLYRDAERFELPGNDGQGIGKTYAQELIQQNVERWVRANQDRSFFLFYAITLPHGRHEIDSLGQYANTDWTPQQKAYAAQVSRLDADVGRLFALLKELKLDENTLVMLSGDNGSSFDEKSEVGRLFDQSMGGKLRGFKRSMYEGGLRQAALARWPGVIPAGRVCDEPWAFWDFLPTATELARAKLPDGFQPDGHSLTTMLKGGPAPRRDYFYWELHEAAFLQAVRFGDWKAVRNSPSKPIELYDLKTDSGERHNLAAEKPELVDRAESLMKSAHRDDPNWPIFENSKQRQDWRKLRATGRPASEDAQKIPPRDEFRIFDGQPTRLYFTGNPHHPTFGREKLAKLLDWYFDGKSPIVVDGLADARKDPITQKPIRPAKIPELIRFLEPVFEAREVGWDSVPTNPRNDAEKRVGTESQPTIKPREWLVVLNYVIVESPRTKTSDDWVKAGADELEKYAQTALQRGTQRMFFAEMVQPNHIQAGQAGNKFRRAGLQVFDELVSRNIAGVQRGPLLQTQLEQHRYFFRDDRHHSDAGRDYIGCLWFETLLKHDGRPVPDWCQDEMRSLSHKALAAGR